MDSRLPLASGGDVAPSLDAGNPSLLQTDTSPKAGGVIPEESREEGELEEHLPVADVKPKSKDSGKRRSSDGGEKVRAYKQWSAFWRGGDQHAHVTAETWWPEQ
jgi:hypothetical protein